MAYLGEMYSNGLGVAQDNETAIKWLERSVAQNSAAGRNNLGYMYLHGYGVKKDLNMALSLFSKAAAQGLPDAQYNLGELYFVGQGTQADFRKAMQYFSLAAQVCVWPQQPVSWDGCDFCSSHYWPGGPCIGHESVGWNARISFRYNQKLRCKC